MNPAFRASADLLGRLCARNGIDVVFGGGHVGLMGVVADAALSEGGRVHGVIPESLVARELAHPAVADMRVTSSMHERKALMAELSDAFVALPGGFGTLDELCEILTWSQLGFHDKPIGLLNVDGYYDHLLAMIDRATAEGFVSSRNRQLVLVENDPEQMLRRLGLLGL
jgi:uncharacterized protein (TIGR00730 family)